MRELSVNTNACSIDDTRSLGRISIETPHRTRALTPVRTDVTKQRNWYSLTSPFEEGSPMHHGKL